MNELKRHIEMDKNMKYGLTIEFHVIFWIVMQVYFFYSMNLFGIPFERSLQSKLFFLPFQLIAAYFMLFVLLGRFLYRGKYIKAILGFILFIFLFSYLASFINTYMITPLMNADGESPSFLSFIMGIEDLIANYMRVIFLTPLILICLEFGVSQFQKMKEVEQLLDEKNKAELHLLKTQIHPDFLLSTLRNLEQLTTFDDPDGLIVIERLSETLDYILYKGGQEKIELQKELQAIEDYVILENIRFKGASKIVLNVEVVEYSRLVSPLILFSFLEFNFVDYIKDNIPFEMVNISIVQKDNLLHCTIDNLKKNQGDSALYSYEVKKIKRQLDISYPERYKLDVKDTKSNYSIHLELEL